MKKYFKIKKFCSLLGLFQINNTHMQVACDNVLTLKLPVASTACDMHSVCPHVFICIMLLCLHVLTFFKDKCD